MGFEFAASLTTPVMLATIDGAATLAGACASLTRAAAITESPAKEMPEHQVLEAEYARDSIFI